MLPLLADVRPIANFDFTGAALLPGVTLTRPNNATYIAPGRYFDAAGVLRMAAGPELVRNGSFSTDPFAVGGGWTNSVNGGTGAVTWNGSNAVTIIGDTVHSAQAGQALTTTAGLTYTITADVTAATAVTVLVGTTFGGTQIGSVQIAPGTGNGATFQAASATTYAVFSRQSATETVIRNASVTTGNNVARFDFDPVTHVSQGLLTEAESTNIIWPANDLTNARWSKTDTTPAAATGITSPDGSIGTATLLTEGSAGTAATYQIATATTSNKTVAAQIYLKPVGGLTWLHVIFGEQSLIGADVWVNAQTGALGTVTARGTATGIAAKSVLLPGGWVLVTGSLTLGTATNADLYLRSAAANGSATRVNGAAYYVWGAGYEMDKPAPTSTILTTTAAATRAADIVTATMPAGTYDVLTQDRAGGAFATLTVAPGATLPITARAGQTHVTRVQAWPSGLSAAEKTARSVPY